MEVSSYPKVRQLGHAEISGEFNVLNGNVIVQEKVDGSQFSFMNDNGTLRCRSKGVQIDMNDPGMFANVCNAVAGIHMKGLLVPGWTYRGEFVNGTTPGKVGHNTLKYQNPAPEFFVGYDIEVGPSNFRRDFTQVREIFAELGMLYAPVYYAGPGSELTMDGLNAYTEKESVLGGGIEGVVIKNYDIILRNGKVAMGKLVRDDFKEKHRGSWKAKNPGQGDIVTGIGQQFATEARFAKLVQHLRERGELTGTPRDIGPLMKEANQDLWEEHTDDIKEVLFKAFSKKIAREASRGLPEWYKKVLAEEALGE